jgi:nitrogen fixation/metabolism regulation signal transduction histidine kinase
MARPGRPRLVPVDLAPLLDSTLAFLTEKLGRREIRVTREFASAPSMAGDPEWLQQVFLNLFLNAADAMPKGGELRVSLRPHGDEVEVRVADSGHGIPAGDLERVFEPYTTKAAGEGSGLGLSVVQGIVADHHGPSKCSGATTRAPSSGSCSRWVEFGALEGGALTQLHTVSDNSPRSRAVGAPQAATRPWHAACSGALACPCRAAS